MNSVWSKQLIVMLFTVEIIHRRQQNTAAIYAVLLLSCFVEILGMISVALSVSETLNVSYYND